MAGSPETRQELLAVSYMAPNQRFKPMSLTPLHAGKVPTKLGRWPWQFYPSTKGEVKW